MARAKATTIEQDDAIQKLVLERGERSPTRVHAQLVKDGHITDYGKGSYSVSENLFSSDTELTPADPSGPWSFAEAEDPEEAQLALDVVVEMFFSHRGRTWPSKNQVAEIARLRRVAPDIPPTWAYEMALAYQLCKEQGRDSRHLDFALG